MQATFTDEVQAIGQKIAQRIGSPQYKIWFEQSTQLSIQEDHLRISVANSFIGQWIQGHFEKSVTEAVAAVLGGPRPIRYVVDSALSSAQNPSEGGQASVREVPARTPPRKKLRTEPPLKLRLESFVVGSKNELAYNAARTVVQQAQSPFNPLFYHGGYGVGKTHLLQGICNEIAVGPDAKRWMYVSAEDFANQYVLALKTRKLDHFRARFRKLDLLAIDDIHFLANKNAMQEEFLHTFNSIDLAGKQIVLASDAHPKEISQLCEKLVSRFVSGMVVRIDPPDFETRCRILNQRAKALNRVLPPDVVEYVAGAVCGSVRELEGALVKLMAFATVSGGKINLSAARQVLAEHIARTDPIVHNSDITSAVAEYFSIKTADIYSAKKDRTVSLARSSAMYLTRRFTQMSFPEIGRAMGNKNHATVILACRKIEQALEKNQELRWTSPTGSRSVRAKEIVETLIEKIS